MTQTVIYHNPKCSTSRKILELIRAKEEPQIVLYLENPPSKTELSQLLSQMGWRPRQLLRLKADEYKGLGLDEDKFSDDEITELMVHHPILIERPVVITARGAVLCRPPEELYKVWG